MWSPDEGLAYNQLQFLPFGQTHKAKRAKQASPKASSIRLCVEIAKYEM